MYPYTSGATGCRSVRQLICRRNYRPRSHKNQHFSCTHPASDSINNQKQNNDTCAWTPNKVFIHFLLVSVETARVLLQSWWARLSTGASREAPVDNECLGKSRQVGDDGKSWSTGYCGVWYCQGTFRYLVNSPSPYAVSTDWSIFKEHSVTWSTPLAQAIRFGSHCGIHCGIH